MLKKLLKFLPLVIMMMATFFAFSPANSENLDIQPQYPSDAIFLTANEGWGIDYLTPENYYIESVLFASYGTPDNYQISSCHAENSLQIVQDNIKNDSLYIIASNGIFGDPCPGIYKKLSIVLKISQNMESPSPTLTLPPTEEPTETPSPTPTESTPEPTNSDSPTNPEPTVLPTEPSVYPSPSQSTLFPEPSFSQLPTMQPTLIVPSESIPPSITNIPFDNTIKNEEDKLVELPNGVVLPVDVAESIQILESPKEVLAAIFTNPAKVFKALSNVGADLPPKKRKTAQQAVFPMIIVGQIAASTTMNLVQRRVGR